MWSQFSSLIDSFSNAITEEDKNWNIQIKTTKEIFQNLTKPKEIWSHIDQYFSSIYILEVDPRDIKFYKPYPYIYKILEQYERRAENRPLQLMFLKYKEDSIIQSKIRFEQLREEFGDAIQFQETSHYLVVGAFWWSTPRANTETINIIKKHLDYHQL